MVALGQVIDAGASFLADLIDRIVNGIRGIATVGGLVLGFGCQSGDRTEIHPAVQPVDQAQVSELETVESAPSDGPTPIGKFNITFYYVIGEDEVAPKAIANDNRKGSGTSDDELASVTPQDLVTLYSGTGKCEPIADVSREFASQLGIQGTGKLKDGRVLNIWGACGCGRSPCFKVTENQWGTAGSGRPLQPFRTVAVDPKVIKLGSLLYVPLLEGRTMPGRAPWGGYVHDGCVVADDTGGGMAGNKLDLFVGRKAYFLGLSGSGGSHSWARHVPVFDGSKICERKGRHVARKTGSI
jgi:3D (Asp-Asp-Asp) domain-containing protein